MNIELDSITYLDIINNAIYEDRMYVTGISEINGNSQNQGTILQINARTLTVDKAIFLDRGALENECATVVEQSDGSIVTTNKYWNGFLVQSPRAVYRSSNSVPKEPGVVYQYFPRSGDDPPKGPFTTLRSR